MGDFRANGEAGGGCVAGETGTGFGNVGSRGEERGGTGCECSEEVGGARGCAGRLGGF